MCLAARDRKRLMKKQTFLRKYQKIEVEAAVHGWLMKFNWDLFHLVFVKELSWRENWQRNVIVLFFFFFLQWLAEQPALQLQGRNVERRRDVHRRRSRQKGAEPQ